MQWQQALLMTQRGPDGTKKENLDIFLRCAGRWPNIDFASPADFEVRDIFDSDERAL
jgi:hypothetical protein